MPMSFRSSNRRRRAQSSYVAPPVQSPSYNFAQSAANHASGYGDLNRSSSMNSLSGSAAAAALRKHQVGPQPTPQVASRSNSLSSRSFRPQQQQRSNSLTATSNGYGQSYSRSSSLTSNTARKKPTIDSDIVTTTVTTTRGKEPNTTIRTTRRLSADGRTRSLTKETITKMGSFEMVKTTVLKPPNNTHEFVKPPSAPSAYYAGSLLSVGDSELENIAEEFDMDYYIQDDNIHSLQEEPEEDVAIDEHETPNEVEETRHEKARIHAYRYLTQSNVNQLNNNNNNNNNTVADNLLSRSKTSSTNNSPAAAFVKPKKIRSRVRNDDEDEDSGDSVYSDAYDLLPSSNNKPSNKSIIKNFDTDSASLTSAQKSAMHRPRRGSNTSSTRKSVRIEAPQQDVKPFSPVVPQDTFNRVPAKETKRKELTPEEMYAAALEVAKQKVYGDRNASVPFHEDEGYESDSSYKRQYSRTTRDEFKPQYARNSASGGRTMSLNSANIGRTMSMTSGQSYEPQQVNHAGFKNHSMRAQQNPITPVAQEKKKRISSLVQRSPSQRQRHQPIGEKVDKKLDKKQRKESIRMMEQQRKEAVASVSQKAELEQQQQQQQQQPVQQPSQSTVASDPSKVKKPARFSIFSKKSKKTKDPISETQPETSAIGSNHPETINNNNTNIPGTPQFPQDEFQGVSQAPKAATATTGRFEYTSPSVMMENSSRQESLGFNNGSTINEEASVLPHTPTLTLSNHAIDENSSEPKTLDQYDDVHSPPTKVQYENYDNVETARAPAALYTVDKAEDVPNATNTDKKKKVKKNKSFGKKVLKWFDLEE